MNPSNPQRPHPEYLKNNLQLIEAEIQLKQAQLDSVLTLSGAEAAFAEHEAAQKERSNPTSRMPESIRILARIRLNAHQTHIAVMQIELQKMQAQREIWQQLLDKGEKPLIEVTGSMPGI